MFNVGVNLYQLETPVKCLLITPNQEVPSPTVSTAEAGESIGNVAGMIVNYFIEKDIPHSIMANGLDLYIFPRMFQSEFGVGKATFLDLSGVGCTNDSNVFENLTGPELEDYMKGLSCDNETWRSIVDYIENLLKSLYF